ncbi:MAG: sulfite oxidase-like oxidoreductase [Alphaproteobacteria bacterium]|nr:sulfite oxidase-like oxidoreductase [Alphaproteobacteria bacterium]
MADDNAGFREKLIRSKERWAREGRLLTGSPDLQHARRLPPGQREVQNWPVLDLGAQPAIPLDKWRLTIDGLVEQPVMLKWDDLKALPQTDSVSDMHCVTQWSRYDNHWKGVTSRTILDLVMPKMEAKHVIFHAYDTYTTNVSLEVFADPDVLLAHSWEGLPISREHGGPLRVVIPRWYLWKSAKWLKRIEFSETDKPGFWEVRGYHNEGDPWLEQRYS